MCLIVDANASSVFLAPGSAVRVWLKGPKGNPRLCTGGLLTRELARVEEARKFLVDLSRAGRLRTIPEEEIKRHELKLKSAQIHRSNDVHVLALAVASGARTLATFDAALSADFKDPLIINRPRGKIYQRPAKQAHLLCHTPKSCGVRAK